MLADVGGNEYLVELASSAVTIINASEYGRIILDLYQKRALISSCQVAINDATAGGMNNGVDLITDNGRFDTDVLRIIGYTDAEVNLAYAPFNRAELAAELVTFVRETWKA